MSKLSDFIKSNSGDAVRRLNPHIFPESSVLSRPTEEPKARTNEGHDGREWEAIIEAAALRYQSDGKMRLRKVSPPARIFGAKGKQRIVFMENPFPDFVGILTGGRAIFLEAKETTMPRLPIVTGGVRKAQIDALLEWWALGACAGVLWRCPEGIRWINALQLWACEKDGKKSVRMDCGVPVLASGVIMVKGKAYPMPDFLAAIV